MRDSLSSLYAITQYLSELERDDKLRSLLSGPEPIDPAVINFITSINLEDPEIASACNRLLLNLEYQRRLLTRMETKEQDFAALAESNLAEIQEKQKQVFTDRSLRSVIDNYERNIHRSISLYTQLLALQIKNGQYEEAEKGAREFSIWLEHSLSLIDRILLYVPGQQGCIFFYVSMLPKIKSGELNNLHQQVKERVEIMDKTLLQLSEASEPDFGYFSTTTQSLLDKALPVISAAIANPSLESISPLASRLQRVELELLFAQDQLRLLNEKDRHAKRVREKLLQLINMLDNYLGLLGTIRSDLERLLAPRNLARAYKDIHIEVDRIPLQVGQEFPPEHLQLLDRYRIETRIAPNIKKNHMILQEEGDLFIIRVEDQVIEEMPFLVIAEKG